MPEMIVFLQYSYRFEKLEYDHGIEVLFEKSRICLKGNLFFLR